MNKDQFDGVYTPNESSSRGTIVSGGYDVDPVVGGIESTMGAISIDKPILGFLYSISRRGITEYWPIKLGKNIIGKGFDSDVRLSEQTVSDIHARLVVQQMKNPEKIIASLRDEGSTNGTMVNGENIAFDNVEIKNGDILTIGDNYQLLFILIDKKAVGLVPSEKFLSINDFENEGGLSDEAGYDFYSAEDDDFYRKGTVAYDGSSVGETGGTKVI